ncbi:putative preprotein translocase, YajC subunit [Gardnerella vaginalis]|uniref:Putative preprotein translocase, YajC subunit n=2 Tax=Gardnerella vaginalis TaxID=2702 RepID=A0A135ZA29_GARVA|nr:putative preprotein translocase, YajC subunit [Gardnerella vaginalis]
MKKRQAEARSFYDSLKPGTEVITIGGIIGKVVSVDTKYEEIVIDSEGSLLRFSFRAVNREYTRPAFISDEESEDDKADSNVESNVEDSNKNAENSSENTHESNEIESSLEVTNKTSKDESIEDSNDDNTVREEE